MKKSYILSLFFCFISLCASLVQVSALDLGEGNFVFIGHVTRDDKSGAYEINDSETERKFTISTQSLKNHKPLSAALAEGAKADQSRFSGAWAQSGNGIDLGRLRIEPITGEKDCPQKIYSTRKIIGVYEGTEWGDFGHVTIKEASGKSVELLGDGEDVFGKKTGVKVSATVQTAQEWLDTGDWGMCVISDFLVGGKRIK